MQIFPSKKIAIITFSLLSPKEIKKMACAKIVTPELYDKEGYPVDGGLMDVRLGVIDPGLRCKTCGGKLKDCTGHFGYIELARPIIHIKHTRTILDMLRCTCRECSRVLLDEQEVNKYYKALIKVRKERGVETYRKKTREIISILKAIKKCPHCKKKQYNFKLEKPVNFYENEKRLSPIEIRLRFEKIPDKDCEILGLDPKFARPEWMVLTVLQIPPVTMRPSITLETGERSEDDLTHKLGDIVRINQRLFENINAGAPEIIVEDLWDLLQYHVITYFDNTLTQIPPARHRSGQPLKTLVERIKSKEGRFRYNLAGKRVNFSARTVISPDARIKLNEVGVPFEVATELTVPERITEWNIKYLKEFVKRGPKTYPGSNYVISADGKKKKITDETREQLLEDLKPGCVVERHIMNGDMAIFNRQPSLHRMSIMCHRIKVLPGKSFRLNPTVCVAPDTKIQLTTGTQRRIDDIKNCWKESELATFDKEKGLTATELKKFWAIKPEEYNTKCYKVTTRETKRDVTATSDHPFYTNKGVKALNNIKTGDKVMIRPLETPLYEEKDSIIATKKDIIKNAPKETYLKHTLRILEELKLIPLNLKDQRSMIIARIIGHLFGDGTFILKNESSRLIFRGKEEDLKVIQNDLQNLGFKPEKIFIKTSNGEIQTIKGKKLRIRGTGAHFEIRHKPLGILFKKLGAPSGDKVKTKYRVPQWIMSAPVYIKREFLAAYFGCELKKPTLRKKSETNFDTLTFKISKTEKNVNAGLDFISDIRKMLGEFDIKISTITKEPGNIRKGGEKTVSLAANIMDNKSKMNLFGKIGYVYNKKNDNKARIAYQYCLLKQKSIQERLKKYSEAKTLRKKGVKFKNISKKLGISIPMLEKWLYGKHKAGLSIEFPKFAQWEKDATEGLENKGLVWETIEKIEEMQTPFVYDITTIKETHNFFANCFLTGNCNPYNADFDGDEMNLHIPQTEEARAESEILMEVQTQIITPKNGFNVIGCVEDAITGNYLLTKSMSVPKEEAVQMLISIGFDDTSQLSFKNIATGKEIFSALMPKNFNFLGNSKSCKKCEKCKRMNCDVDAYICIKNGKLLCGIIDSNTIGEGNGTLLRALHREYEADKTLELMSSIFQLGIAVLLRRGFTTGVSDTDLPPDILEKIEQLRKETEKKVEEQISIYKEGKLEALPSKTVEETLELMILQLLNRLRNKVGDIIAESVSERNPTIVMARSGARGNLLYLAQMAACVGQQALRGKRIEKGYAGRTLPLFKKGDLAPPAHGFIRGGLKTGINPYEFFFYAMTGRDSLMDTALRTPKSGYLYRRLSNALQDLRIEYDSTVRNAIGNIVQFNYGEDGIDISKSEGGTINIKKIVKDIKGE